MFQPTIDKDELKKLPLESFTGTIHVIDSMDGLKKYLPVLKQEKVIGFDTETRPSFQKGKFNQISLVQMATNFHAFLVRIAALNLPDGMGFLVLLRYPPMINIHLISWGMGSMSFSQIRNIQTAVPVKTMAETMWTFRPVIINAPPPRSFP